MRFLLLAFLSHPTACQLDFPAVNFDYDGKSDLTVFRPSNNTWYGLSSESKYFFGVPWGLETDVLVPADYDGDGLTDMAVWRPENGIWYVLQSRDRQLFTVRWGTITSVPPGIFARCSRSRRLRRRRKRGFCRLATCDRNVWYVLESLQGYNPARAKIFQWGKLGDIPVPADYDGDGKTDFAIWRSTENRWYIFESQSRNWKTFRFGLAGFDLLIPADYTGDGKADIAVFRDGNWFIQKSEDGEYSVLLFRSANRHARSGGL